MSNLHKPSAWVQALRLVAGWLLLMGLGVVFYHYIDFRLLYGILKSANPWLLVLAGLINFGNLGCKAMAWRILLGQSGATTANITALRLFRYAIATAAVSAVTPARAGEAFRVWLLKRYHNVPVTQTISVAITEKLLDATALIALLTPLPWLMQGLPGWVARAIGICGACGVLLFGVLWGVARRTAPAGRMAAIMVALRQPPKRLALAVLVLTGAWLVDLTVLWLAIHAVGAHVPWTAGLFVLLSVNLAIAIPSTPAQLGVLEAGAVVAMTVLKVPRDQALAAATAYHAAQIVPMLVVALIDIRFITSARRPFALAEGEADSP